ncbi:IS3 family transposase [Paenibacillus popilliae]|uniref:IS3 family transposase n=1 Tax=Paenibacillus popilliae TaxID=78057 RepID=UPI0021AE8DF8|nr:IS3 family transposase [Paenibacillus sp. SDF0028]
MIAHFLLIISNPHFGRGHSSNLHHLELELYDYVNWFNKHRIYGTLGYLTPVPYHQEAFKKSCLKFTVDNPIYIIKENRVFKRR